MALESHEKIKVLDEYIDFKARFAFFDGGTQTQT
jgi:hypothetical protein